MKSDGDSFLSIAFISWDSKYQIFTNPIWDSLWRLPTRQTQEGLYGELTHCTCANNQAKSKETGLILRLEVSFIEVMRLQRSFVLQWKTMRLSRTRLPGYRILAFELFLQLCSVDNREQCKIILVYRQQTLPVQMRIDMQIILPTAEDASFASMWTFVSVSIVF